MPTGLNWLRTRSTDYFEHGNTFSGSEEVRIRRLNTASTKAKAVPLHATKALGGEEV
jgi:hypothetical protein